MNQNKMENKNKKPCVFCGEMTGLVHFNTRLCFRDYMAITLSIIESVRNGELIDELAIEIYIKEWLVPLNAGKAKEDPLWIVRTS